MAVETKTVTIDNQTGREGRMDAATPGNSRWWDRAIPKRSSETVQVHMDVVPYVKHLMSAWSRHDYYDRCHDRIYENRALQSMRGARAALSSAGFNPARLAVTTNIVDTFHSRVERRRPMPMVVVDDATYELQRQASEFQSFLRGKMRERDVDAVSSGVVRDACVRGSGIAYVDEGEDDVVVEKVHRWELYVDPFEAAAGGDAVRQMHRVKRVAREVLIAMFPESEAAIKAAPATQRRDHETGAEEWANPVGAWTGEDVIDVYLSWHLPSCTWREDGKRDQIDDGRKAICVEGGTLVFERWTRPRFPFAILRRHVRQDGFWGQGDVERLAEDQHDINKIARDIQRNVEMDGHLKVFTPEALDKTPTEKLTGRGPFRVRYPGATPPAYVPPNPVSAAHLRYLEQRIAWMHQVSGVAEWSAQGRSPLGAGASGVALDTMEDIQSDRHASFEARYSRWRCEVAQLIIDAARAVAKRKREQAGDRTGAGYAATWMEHGTMRRIEWDSAAMEDECYRLDIEPTSFVPNTRAGKLAAIRELSGLGIWSPERMLELFDEPDVAHASREQLAKLRNARRVMTLLGDPSKEAPFPEPEWGYELHADMALAYYNLALCDGAPEDVAARFRDYRNVCLDEIAKAKSKAPAPENPMAAGAAPEMPPMPGALAPSAPPMDPTGGVPPGAPMMPPSAA